MAYVAQASLIGPLILLVVVGGSALRAQLIDKATVNRIIRNFRPIRHDIARDFTSLRTQWGKLRYVEELERLTVQHFEALKMEDNVWPNDVRPQGHDLASTKLAEIDARWLGID
jgi:hypothetical protein